MTVLHFVRSFGKKIPGGAEINVENLVIFLYENHKIKSIIISDYGVWTYNKNSKKIVKIKNITGKRFLLELIFGKYKMIKNIHVHSNGYVIFLGYIIALLIKAKLLIKITRIAKDSLISRERFFSRDIKLLIKRILLKIICKSNFVRLHCLTKSAKITGSIFSKNIVIFPNLIKSKHRKLLIKKEKSILISSRIIKRKNIDLALDEILKIENYSKYEIVVIGDGPELKNLKNKYKKISNIKFRGHINKKDISDYYAKSEFFINLSNSEGMSNAFIEAMVNGCKCIVSDIPENRDTASKYAIFYKNNSDFSTLVKNASSLLPSAIADFAKENYTLNNQNCKLIKELYKN